MASGAGGVDTPVAGGAVFPQSPAYDPSLRAPETLPGTVSARGRYAALRKQGITAGRWTADEDSALIAIVREQGEGDWSAKSKALGGSCGHRSDTALRKRWDILGKCAPESAESEVRKRKGPPPSAGVRRCAKCGGLGHFAKTCDRHRQRDFASAAGAGSGCSAPVPQPPAHEPPSHMLVAQALTPAQEDPPHMPNIENTACAKSADSVVSDASSRTANTNIIKRLAKRSRVSAAVAAASARVAEALTKQTIATY